MVVCPSQNFRVYISVNNFKTQNKELDFGDFKIFSVKQGPEAAEWTKKLRCRDIPRYVLIKKFPNYKRRDDDITGFDGIIDSMQGLLRLFRLFKVGDIMFSCPLIVDTQGKNSWFSPYSSARHSYFKYNFARGEIEKFNSFRDNIAKKAGYRNKFYEFSLNHFMSGIDEGFRPKIGKLERIVDYVVALESVFLSDNKPYFLRHTLAERTSAFLEDASVKIVVKHMYDERSNIVHGNYIDLSENKRSQKIEKTTVHMPKFEGLMRDVFKKLFDFNFFKKEDIVRFMEQLYTVRPHIFKIMQSAKEKADRAFKNLQS